MKAKTNFVIDALMFIVMMALTGTGYVRKYILLSGSKSREVYGYKVDMTLLGIDRDGWSAVHLYLGYILLALLALHIILHWQVIMSIYRRLIPNPPARTAITLVFVILAIILIIFPFIIKPQIT